MIWKFLKYDTYDYTEISFVKKILVFKIYKLVRNEVLPRGS